MLWSVARTPCQPEAHVSFVYVTADFAVAAIDSRKNTPAGHDDTACKITCLDDSTVFLCQGIVEGWGSHFHVSNSLFAELRAFLCKRKHKYVDGHRALDKVRIGA